MAFLPETSPMLHDPQLVGTAAAGGISNHSQSQVTANNLSGPLIPNQQPAAITIQPQQLQAQISYPHGFATAQTLMQNGLNLQAPQALPNSSVQLPGTTANVPNIVNNMLSIATGAQSTKVHQTQQHRNAPHQMPDTAVGALQNQLNVSFPSARHAPQVPLPTDVLIPSNSQSQRSSSEATLTPRYNAYQLQHLNILLGLPQNLSSNLNQMTTAQSNSVNNNYASSLNDSALPSQTNHNVNRFLTSNLQATGTSTERNNIDIAPSVANNNCPTVASLMAAVSARPIIPIEQRQQSDALLNNSPNNSSFREFVESYLSFLTNSRGGEDGSDSLKDESQGPSGN